MFHVLSGWPHVQKTGDDMFGVEYPVKARYERKSQSVTEQSIIIISK